MFVRLSLTLLEDKLRCDIRTLTTDRIVSGLVTRKPEQEKRFFSEIINTRGGHTSHEKGRGPPPH